MTTAILRTDRWSSGQPTKARTTENLQHGDIVIADRKPFRVSSIRSLPSGEWSEKYIDVWRGAGMPDTDTWDKRPVHIYGAWDTPDSDGQQQTAMAPANHRWDVLPEHYTVCRRCQELPPCTHVERERILDRAAASMAKAMDILPGTCHGCHEPITRRQKSFTFPGTNLTRPDFGDDSAIFHTRSDCYGALASYDKRWAAAEPGRQRLFYCDGLLITHVDGSSECAQGDCTGKGEWARLVRHRAGIWHRPGIQEGHYDVMRAFGGDPGTGHENCWCLRDAKP